MKEAFVSLYCMRDDGIKYNTADGYSVDITLCIQDDEFCKALYYGKIKNIKFLYEVEDNWEERLKKEKIKDIKKSIKELQKELKDLEGE